MPHGSSSLVSLSKYFEDPNGDDMTMTATDYRFNGGPSVVIPDVLFTLPEAFKINIASSSLSDVGTYVINLKV